MKHGIEGKTHFFCGYVEGKPLLIGECVNVELCGIARGNDNLFQLGTSPEGMRADLFERLGKGNLLELYTPLKGLSRKHILRILRRILELLPIE